MSECWCQELMSTPCVWICKISAESALLMSSQYTNASWVFMSKWRFWVLMSSFDIQLWVRASDKQELMSDTHVKALMFDWSNPPMSSFLRKKLISILPEKRSLELVFCPKKNLIFARTFLLKISILPEVVTRRLVFCPKKYRLGAKY